MIFSTVVAASVLSLLSFTRAATIHTRQDDCTFVCPESDLGGNALDTSTTSDSVISCSYVGEPSNLCTYDPTSGELVGDGDCPESATQQCIARRDWELGQAVGPKRDDVPPSTSGWPTHTPPPSWSPSPSPSWSPSPSPSWSPSPSKPKPKPSSPPSTPQPCKFRCPQQDLAKNPLTDEAFRKDGLFCGYSTPHCKTCSFCKYNLDTGVLIEDNDDGNCPKKASAARPWDRR